MSKPTVVTRVLETAVLVLATLVAVLWFTKSTPVNPGSDKAAAIVRPQQAVAPSAPAINTIAPASTITPSAFESVYRASKALASSTALGTTIAELRNRISALNTEVSIARDRAQSEESRSLIAEYTIAVATYADSRSIWELQIELGHLLPVEGPVLTLVRKYHLAVTTPREMDSGSPQRPISALPNSGYRRFSWHG